MSDAAELLTRFGDFAFYAPRCLKIKPKVGSLVPLELNKAQAYINTKLDEQLTTTGKVRALVLKGRQQGCSTLIGARFYHKTTRGFGVRTFILTHEQAATDNLFAIANRYHDNCPAELKPRTGAANAKELAFPGLDSGYEVGTAGTKAVGRSKTVQLLHGSEVAFWPNAASHFAGVVQAVPDMPGTEIILESTANGVGGEYHERWQQAEAGVGDYAAIFVPWFWQEEYRRSIPAGFAFEPDENEYALAHALDMGQMVWRRAKIAELKDPLLFRQEYPATAAEAFQVTGHDSFIAPALVLKARKAEHEGFGPLVIGADPARFGDDGFSLAWRNGRKVSKTESRHKLDVVEGANWIRQVIDDDAPARVFVDVGGLGAGTVDILKSWGGVYASTVVGVNFGSEPFDAPRMLPDGTREPGPRNRRAEMWSKSREWLQDVAGADLPDKDRLQADACAPGYRYDVNQRLLLESKEDMRRRGVRSPDEWDAIALTFAEPVAERRAPQSPQRQYGATGWMGV